MRALLSHFRESAEPCSQEAVIQESTFAEHAGDTSDIIPSAWNITVLPNHLPGTSCLMCMLLSGQDVIAMTAIIPHYQQCSSGNSGPAPRYDEAGLKRSATTGDFIQIKGLVN